MPTYEFNTEQLRLLTQTPMKVLEAAHRSHLGLALSRTNGKGFGASHERTLTIAAAVVPLCSATYDTRRDTGRYTPHLGAYATPEHEAAAQGLMLGLLRAARVHWIAQYEAWSEDISDQAPETPRDLSARRALDWIMERTATTPEPAPEGDDTPTFG